MPTGRIDGFDLLRGLCAIGVLVYHLLSWRGLRIANLGLYGVYIFFVLSGASLYVSYAGRFAHGFSIARFIGLRFFRLAPLYTLVVLATLVLERRVYDADAWQRAVLNITFLFGFSNPGETSVVTGGWSLGIEFVFYCIFPVLVAVLARGIVIPALAVAAAFTCQMLFVHHVLAGAGDTLTSNWVAYTQPLAFVFYFVAGCAIGRLVLQARTRFAHPVVIWTLFAAILLTIGTTSGPDGASSLTGTRGVLLSLLSVAAVLVAAYLPIGPRFQWIAAALGAMSYGVYLMHPLLAKLPLWRLPLPLYVAGLIVVTAAVALVVERWFERPIRRVGANLLGRHERSAAQQRLSTT